MPIQKRPLREYPKDTRALGKFTRSLEVQVGGDEIHLVDADIPNSIARDSEVTAAVAAEATARNGAIATAIDNHEMASNPHPGYLTEAEGDALYDAIGSAAALNVTSGVYTPTLTNVANLDASTAYQCQYLRVDSTVFVSGKVDVDPTGAGAGTQLGISLPIASNLGAAEDCAGVAFASGIGGQGAAILGDAANNRAQMQWVALDLTNQPMYFSFGYRVI